MSSTLLMFPARQGKLPGRRYIMEQKWYRLLHSVGDREKVYSGEEVVPAILLRWRQGEGIQWNKSGTGSSTPPETGRRYILEQKWYRLLSPAGDRENVSSGVEVLSAPLLRRRQGEGILEQKWYRLFSSTGYRKKVYSGVEVVPAHLPRRRQGEGIQGSRSGTGSSTSPERGRRYILEQKQYRLLSSAGDKTKV